MNYLDKSTIEHKLAFVDLIYCKLRVEKDKKRV